MIVKTSHQRRGLIINGEDGKVKEINMTYFFSYSGIGQMLDQI